MVSRDQLKERYHSVRERIAAAAERSGRRPSDVICVAVTKLAGPDQIRHLIEMGHQDLGESRVQQLQQRVAMSEEFLSRRRLMGDDRASAPASEQSGVPDVIRWHLIGHLQRNKVKPMLPLVKLIHSVDSLRLAEEIETQAAKADREAEVLLQVNASGERGKFGLAPPAVSHFAEQVQSMVHLRLRGLMTMAPHSEDPEAARPTFERTAELFDDMRKTSTYGTHFNILSMGMSNDFETAIECGANIVRIGTALFGESAEE